MENSCIYLNNNNNKLWNYYLCVQKHNSLTSYECTRFSSFDEADSYYKINNVKDLDSLCGIRKSTIIPVHKLLPQAVASTYIDHSLKNMMVQTTFKHN